MEFINKIKNIIEDTFTDDTEDSTVLNPSNGNDNNIEDKRDKSMSDKVIEKALLGVKKYYQFKIKVINNVNYIENEWSFWDKIFKR